MKPYYQDSHVTIYHGDSRQLVGIVNADVIVTDPPYGIAHPTDYAARGRSALARCVNHVPVFADDEPFDPSHLLALNLPTVLWGGNYFADKLPATSGWLVWDKMRPHELDQATAELAWTNYVKGCRVFRHLWHGMMKASEHSENYHPTQKPVALMTWVLTLKWTPAGTVFDPYMGSGPTLRAAKDLGRKAIGIEIEERYCEIAAKRMAQEVFDFAAA